jgi:predicted ATPase
VDVQPEPADRKVHAFRFESLAARGREAMREEDVARASALFDEALRLWRGDALVDVADDPFAQADRTRLTEMRVATIEARIEADLALGRHAALVAELEQLVLEYPMREHLRAQLMLALSRSGRQTEALRSYRSARAVLGDELGLEPSPELRALETAILRQDKATVRRDAEPTPPQPGANLRTPLTSLVGRRGALDALAFLLRTRRLVTLVGPGGVGKTRLAIEAARELLEAESTNVWLVELADVRDPDGVVSAIAAALGLRVSIDAKIDLTRVVDFLCGRSTLVLLDNCEHLVESAAHVAQDLLEFCPTLRILATSREALGVPSEVTWPVPPLALGEAVALFVERGYAAAPTSDLGSDATKKRILLESICTRLDGLPLAIELAASRLAAMPLGELAVGLDDRFRLLNRGARTARPRQQTLRAVVDWSYDLLFEDERRVLNRLSVFTGGCELSAARVVCADEEISGDDVAELVTRLADKSLITIEETDADGHVRCRMPQTLVEYGRERLAASGDATDVRAAHARYYCDLALGSVAALRGERQRSWLRSIASNMGNLRAVLEAAIAAADVETAHRIAGSLGWYWWFTGRALEGSGWLTLAYGDRGATGAVTRARLLAWAAFTRAPGFVLWADPDEHVPMPTSRSRDDIDELCAEAVSLYREAGVVDELVGIETALAVTYSTRGNHARARDLLRDANQILAGLGPAPWVTAMLAFVSARRAFVEDRYDDAEEAFRASIPLLDAIGGQVYCSFAYRYIGRLSELRGDHDASIRAIEVGLQLARDLGLSAFVNVLLTDLGASLAAKGDFEGARRVLEQPLASARDQRSPAGIGESLTALAWVEWRANNTTEAARLAAEALVVARAAEDHDTVAHCHAILGLVAERHGDVADARAHHRRGLDVARQTGEPRRLALALEGLAAVAMREQDGWAAASLGGAATTLRRSSGRATGWAFASVAPVDTSHLMGGATETIGAAAVAAAYASGVEDPQAVVMSIAATPS